MPDPIEDIADQHVTKSLEELDDPAKRERWASGERAKEQAAEIVSSIVAGAMSELEKEKPSES